MIYASLFKYQIVSIILIYNVNDYILNILRITLIKAVSISKKIETAFVMTL